MSAKTVNDFLALVTKDRDKYIKLARDIWARPETGMEERFACAEQTRILREFGFSVETPFAGLETAYRAVSGSGGPVFCYTTEYDAPPEGGGHSCGHNLICAAAVAAGRALSQALAAERIPGAAMILGTPAEESHGGKVIMLKNGALDGVDAVMMAHPSWRTTPDPGSTAVRQFEVVFKGRAAHAGIFPEKGLNALDAVIALFNAVSAWRQHLRGSARIHGIIFDGGKAPNTVPDRAGCRFLLRSPEDDYLDFMEKRFRDIAEGAALMTGTEREIKNFSNPYKARKPNPVLNRLFKSAAETLGMSPVTLPGPLGISSDFGDFSHERPGAHVYFGVTQGEISTHSPGFTEASNSDFAMEQTLKTAAAMASAGYDYITDSKIQEEAAKAT